MKWPRIACALVLVAPFARAAPEPDPAALALFRQGRALLAEGRWSEGCAKIAESHAREPHASALLNLARCDEHEGRVASAWTRTHGALPLIARIGDPVRRGELRETAEKSLAALEPRLPKLRVLASEPLAGLRVEDDAGRMLPVGEELPFDPGPRRIRVTAHGRKPKAFEVVLAESRTVSLSVTLEREVPADPQRGTSAPALSWPLPARPVSPPPSPPASSSPWPFVTGTAAIALAGVAVGFGVDAANANASLHARCGADLVCDEDPSYDPGPTNARKDRGLGLAVGLGASALVAGLVTYLLVDRGRAVDEPAALARRLGPLRF